MKQSAYSPKRSNRRAARRIGAPPGPRQADQRRATLVEAAGRPFVEKGYEATSMDEIAAAANFAKGTLYHYFTNKAELLQVLREGFEKEIMIRVRSRVESCPADDWRGRLEAWIEAAVMFYGFRGGFNEATMGTQHREDVPKKLNDLFLRILGVHD